MSENEVTQEFWNRTDEFIKVANQQSGDTHKGEVSSSFLYAAARFNAYIVALAADDVEGLKQNKEEAIKYFSDQYSKMFRENIEDYIARYDEYL